MAPSARRDLPIVDQLRENFGVEEADGDPEIVARVEEAMRRMGQLEPHIPYIRYVLSVHPGDPGVGAMEATARRKRVFGAISALCLRGAFMRPIVLVFEDLHWIDHSTEEYLTQLIDSLATARIMLILTYRLGYSPRWGARSFQTTITLDTLSEAETLVLAGRVLGVEHFPTELRGALMSNAEGVPLFAEEVTKVLLDLGILRRVNGSYRLAKRVDEISAPATIQGIIMAGLDRLGENGKRIVQLASVIGRQFLRRLLERIAAWSCWGLASVGAGSQPRCIGRAAWWRQSRAAAMRRHAPARSRWRSAGVRARVGRSASAEALQAAKV